MPPEAEKVNENTDKIDGVEVQNVGDEKERPSLCKRFTNVINSALERFFARVGFVVATNPWKTIIIGLIVCGLCIIGITEYQVENRGDKNWVSQSSDSIKHKDWVEEKFPAKFRLVNVMLEDQVNGNILNNDSLVELYKVHVMVQDIEKTTSRKWENICYKTVGDECIPDSILMLWRYDLNVIRSLTTDEILAEVNKKDLRNPYTNQPLNIKHFIGGPVVNKTVNNVTKIVEARVAKINYKIINDEEFDDGKGRNVAENAEAWEESFDGKMELYTNPSHRLYYYTQWGSSEASDNASSGDTQFFVVGYILVIIYLSIMLGSFSRINHKIWLALCGILVIGMAIGVAYGLGSAFQMKSTGVHNVLPFLLLGIGVDDIFVIIQTWDNIKGPQADDRTVPQKMSETLRAAGVSILVTSITDVCAFFIGATTILPALRSFCIWCGVGILAVFSYTLTFFVAWLSLDAKRQQNRRDACCCCVKLNDDWEPTECSKKSYLQLFLEKYYAPALLSVPGKIIGLLVVGGCLAGGIVGVARLEQDFDFNWFLPSSSAPRQYTDNVEIFFPSEGATSHVYTGSIDYNDHVQGMESIYDELINDPFTADGTVYSWHHDYLLWLRANNKCPNGTVDLKDCKLSNTTVFEDNLQSFLSDVGKVYRKSIAFHDNNKTVKAGKIEFKHVDFKSSSEEIEGMDSVQEEIYEGVIPHPENDLLPFAFSEHYIGWETNKVISAELRRNLGLASLVVFIVALFLLSHFGTALMVLLCIVLALVDIAGFMHFWGLTVDTVTTIILVLAIGLTVDYSAHTAHAFMVAGRGDRNERMKDALVEIGPAVMHGGFSTFLAFVLLAASESYVFFTFFKVFFLVVCFGLLHGLVFLPIFLSLVGPGPYKVIKTKRRVSVAYHYDTKEEKEEKRRATLTKDEPIKLEKMTTKGGDVYDTKAPESPAIEIENPGYVKDE